MMEGGHDITQWVNVLLNAGTGAFVLYWFMWKATPAISDMARSIDRLGRIMVTLSLTVAQHLSHSEAIQEQCDGYKKELDEAEALREKK